MDENDCNLFRKYGLRYKYLLFIDYTIQQQTTFRFQHIILQRMIIINAYDTVSNAQSC